MSGELGMDIHRICFSNDFAKPYNDDSLALGNKDVSIDLNMFCESGSTFHICGNNDWAYLVTNALIPLERYAENVFNEMSTAVDNYDGTPEVIVLGKNEYRAVDILHRLRGTGEPISVYKNIPVIKSEESNCIKLLGNKKTLDYLSF